ncbi:MAG: hypothetical protein ACKV2U_19265 [Bryobacteraceae bacterium]
MADVDPFSNDDYCARLNGQRLVGAAPVYTGMTPEIRRQGGAAMQKFIENHIAARRSFAFETALRDVTFEQARRATANGFRVEMVFVAAGPVEEHIKRVANRGEFGGHSASEASLREIYAPSVEMVRGNRAQILVERAPSRFDAVVRGTQFEFAKFQMRARDDLER